MLLFNFEYSPKKMQGEEDRSSERYSVNTNLKVHKYRALILDVFKTVFRVSYFSE